jgi:hypothetical protein
MNRAFGAVTLISLLAVAGAACTRNHGTKDATGGQGMAPAPRGADPMAFVLLHGADLQRILGEHADDCDRALSELLGFLADRKEAYLDTVRGKPAGWLPPAPDDAGPVQLFMEYAERCPDEVARLNSAIHALTH